MDKHHQADRARSAALRPAVIFASASILALSAGSASAAAAAAAADAGSTGAQLEEVVVTARRVTENVQTIPVSVSSVSLKQIQDQNIQRLENIQKFTPNLTVISNGPSSVAPMLFMRGIGSPSVALYSEPPIALYVDGVYTPRPTSAAFDIPDMGGVQVLRGPQGTLFGRNTTGGAILITTQAPRHDRGGELQVGYGSDNDWNESVVLHSGDLDPTTKLRFKLVGQTHDRNGWVEFPGFNKSQWGGALHSRSISLTGDMDITDKLTADAAVGYSKLKSAVGFQTLAASAGALAYFGQSPTYGGPPFLIGQQPLDLAYRDPRQISNEADITTKSARLNLTYDAGDALVLKSITAYSKINENLTGQLGGSYVLGKINVLGQTVISPIITHLTPSEPGNQNQFSQEFNANGKLFEDFSYVAGLYYFQEHADETVRTVQASAPAAATSVLTVTDRSVAYAERTKSYAAFGQLTYKPHQFDGKLEISAGLRWTKDKKTLASETFATSSATGLTTTTGTLVATGLPGASTTPGAVVASTARETWSNTGWAASISYQLTPSIYTFARASSAFRAGGFNAISTNSPGYAPEKAISYEGGVKSEWLDQRLRVNVVAFYTDYKDLQITQYIGPPRNTTFITNAGRSHYSGYELEAQALLGHGFSADLNYGYVFPKYKEYIIGAIPLPASCAAAPTDPSCFQNVAGVARFPFVSKQSVHVGAQWVSPHTDLGVFTLRADYSYKSSFLFGALDLLSPNNTKVHSGIDRNLSARIILSEIPIGGDRVKLKVQAFGDNLTNNRFVVEAVDFSTTMNGIFNRPRNYGVIVTADF